MDCSMGKHNLPKGDLNSINAEANSSSKLAEDMIHIGDAGQKQSTCQHVFIITATFNRFRKSRKESVLQCGNQTFMP